MASFSKISQKRLETCHPDLQRLFNEVIKHFDCVVVCGYRGEEDQNQAYAEGKSEKKWPDSKHNTSPSIAVDVAPFNFETKRIDWEDSNRFRYFAGVVKGIAIMMGISVRQGIDWNGNTLLNDQTFNDLPHWELVD